MKQLSEHAAEIYTLKNRVHEKEQNEMHFQRCLLDQKYEKEKLASNLQQIIEEQKQQLSTGLETISKYIRIISEKD